MPAGSATQRHYHRLSEEFYFILDGSGIMETDGETRKVNPGDCILIPPTAWHSITPGTRPGRLKSVNTIFRWLPRGRHCPF